MHPGDGFGDDQDYLDYSQTFDGLSLRKRCVVHRALPSIKAIVTMHTPWCCSNSRAMVLQQCTRHGAAATSAHGAAAVAHGAAAVAHSAAAMHAPWCCSSSAWAIVTGPALSAVCGSGACGWLGRWRGGDGAGCGDGAVGISPPGSLNPKWCFSESRPPESFVFCCPTTRHQPPLASLGSLCDYTCVWTCV